MPFKIEARQRAAVRGQFALALNDVDGDVGLAIDAGGEVFGGGGGDGGVALNDPGDHATECLDAERKRSDIEQQHVFGGVRAAGEDIGLHGSAERDDLVRIELGVRLLTAGTEAEELIDESANGGDAGRAADQDDLVDLVRE